MNSITIPTTKAQYDVLVDGLKEQYPQLVEELDQVYDRVFEDFDYALLSLHYIIKGVN